MTKGSDNIKKIAEKANAKAHDLAHGAAVVAKQAAVNVTGMSRQTRRIVGRSSVLRNFCSFCAKSAGSLSP